MAKNPQATAMIELIGLSITFLPSFTGGKVAAGENRHGNQP